MSSDFQMIELRPDSLALVRFLEGQGNNRRRDEDMGYGVHAWLAAAFGDRGPKPFRLLMDRRLNQPPRVLGYGKYNKTTLVEHMTKYADPAVFTICTSECISTKPMPSKWNLGHRYNFEILVCPVSRKNGVEKDVFLRKADMEGKKEGLDREGVYANWLARQFTGIAKLNQVKLASFRMTRFYRKGKSNSTAKNLHPQALMTGELQIIDEMAFGTIIERGIGRHRAFGYGMLLLRPL